MLSKKPVVSCFKPKPAFLSTRKAPRVGSVTSVPVVLWEYAGCVCVCVCVCEYAVCCLGVQAVCDYAGVQCVPMSKVLCVGVCVNSVCSVVCICEECVRLCTVCVHVCTCQCTGE